MRHRLLAGFLATASIVAGSAFAMGCSAEATDDEDYGGAESEMKGTLANAQACAVRDAYLDAELTDFEDVLPAQLPFAYNPPAGVRPIIAKLKVRGVGTVYFIEYTAQHSTDGGGSPTSVQGQFRTADGRLIVSSSAAGTSAPTQATFYIAGTGQRLSCGSGSSSSGGLGDAGVSSSSSGGWDDASAWAYDAGPSSSGGWGSSGYADASAHD